VERLRQLYEQAPPEPGEAKWKEWLEERLARDERLELERATRAEIGDEAYDEMLYADGRNNAVRVRKLLEHSAGRAFGLEPGDVVLRYDGERVFNAQDLRQAAKQGNPGDTVIMDVLRGDEILPLTGPRGPIGFRPVGTLVPPSGVWYH
jgi:membrane-associated protease RseP (regulator of RpoE activity)